MSETLEVGLIGAGGIARAHAAAARVTGGRVVISAVVDPAEQARQGLCELTEAPGYASMDELLADGAVAGRLGGVVVCTPPSIREQVIGAALERGWAVLAEKPLAHSVESAQRLVDLASRHEGVACAVGFCHRFTPAVIEVRRMIEAGELGEVVRFENVFACWHPTMQTRWMSDPAVSGGGSLVDTGSHSFDLLQYLLGPARVESAVLAHAWAGRGDSGATVLLRVGESGPAAVVMSGWTEPARFAFTVVGTKALVSYDYEEPEALRFKPSEGEAKVVRVESHEARFTRQLEAFAALAADPSGPTELARFDDGLSVNRLVESVHEAQAVAAG